MRLFVSQTFKRIVLRPQLGNNNKGRERVGGTFTSIHYVIFLECGKQTEIFILQIFRQKQKISPGTFLEEYIFSFFFR